MKVEFMGIKHTKIKDWPMHSHNIWEVIINLEGSGYYTVNDKKYPFGPGSIICFPPETIHGKTSDGLFRDLYMRINSPFFYSELYDDGILCYQDDEEKTVEMLMLYALKVYYKRENGYTEILDSVANTIQAILKSKSKSLEKNKDIELFKNIMIENFTNPDFSVSNAMENVSYNHDYFGRYFKKETGLTPSEFLNNLRMNYAAKLLRQSRIRKITVSEISYMSGYYDRLYFSRVFKKKFGVSPRSYLDI